MNKKTQLWIDIVVLMAIVGAGMVYLYSPTATPTPIGDGVCTEEAKQCPDGSYVGRTGPACQFAACPDVPIVVTPASGSITIGVGQTGTVGDFEITFNSFVQDSRCPIDVQCIQAGAVNINVTFTHGAHTKTIALSSAEVPQRALTRGEFH